MSNEENTNTAPDNVVNIRSKKSVLPFQVRGIIMAQYLESKEKDQNAEEFVLNCEDKLKGWMATALVDKVVEGGRNIINEIRSNS